MVASCTFPAQMGMIRSNASVTKMMRGIDPSMVPMVWSSCYYGLWQHLHRDAIILPTAPQFRNTSRYAGRKISGNTFAFQQVSPAKQMFRFFVSGLAIL